MSTGAILISGRAAPTLEPDYYMKKPHPKRSRKAGSGEAVERRPLERESGSPPPLPEKVPLDGRMTLPVQDQPWLASPKTEVEFELHEDVELALAVEVEQPDETGATSAVPPPLPDRSSHDDVNDLEDRVTVPAPRGEQAAEVTIEIDGLPAGAWVELDGVPAEPPLVVPRSGDLLKLEIRADGFVTYEDRLIPDRDLVLRPELIPADEE
jgi:hypothetical protein